MNESPIITKLYSNEDVLELIRRLTWPPLGCVTCRTCGTKAVSNGGDRNNPRYACIPCRKTWSTLSSTPLARTPVSLIALVQLLRTFAVQNERVTQLNLAKTFGFNPKTVKLWHDKYLATTDDGIWLRALAQLLDTTCNFDNASTLFLDIKTQHIRSQSIEEPAVRIYLDGNQQTIPIIAPKIGSDDNKMTVSIVKWYLPNGSRVRENDDLVELQHCGTHVVLPSPATGILYIANPTTNLFESWSTLAHISTRRGSLATRIDPSKIYIFRRCFLLSLLAGDHYSQFSKLLEISSRTLSLYAQTVETLQPKGHHLASLKALANYFWGSSEEWWRFLKEPSDHVLVHIPGGEHAMRNQRVAQALGIPTVAVLGSGEQDTSGYRTADTQFTVDGYTPEAFDAVLRRITETHATQLRSATGRMWILCEAHSYRQDILLDSIERINEEVRAELRYAGRLVGDALTHITNDTFRTRELASQVDIPQPRYQHLVDYDTVTQLPKPLGELIWKERVESFARKLGKSIVVKPSTREFLKGSTFVSAEPTPEEIDHAWKRRQQWVSNATTLIEEEIEINCEIMITIIERPDRSFVDVPPVYYRCKRFTHAGLSDIPATLDFAWMARNGTSSVADDMVLGIGLPKLYAAAQQAKILSHRFARYLWRGCPENRFLLVEWYVQQNGELIFNECKPTQDDKGIITHHTMNLSDSELLVRNLFRHPLPESVTFKPEMKLNVGFLGCLVVSEPADGRCLKELDDVAALSEGIARLPRGHLELLDSKFGCVPYLGRRIGTIYFESGSISEALTTWHNLQKSVRLCWS